MISRFNISIYIFIIVVVLTILIDRYEFWDNGKTTSYEGIDNNRLHKIIPEDSLRSLENVSDPKVFKDKNLIYSEKLKKIGNKIEKIDLNRLSEKLSEEQVNDLNNHLKDLRRNYNISVFLLKDERVNTSDNRFQDSYKKTLSSWEYIVKNYRI